MVKYTRIVELDEKTRALINRKLNEEGSKLERARWVTPELAADILENWGKKVIGTHRAKYDGRDLVYLYPNDERFVPCGWYSRKWLENLAGVVHE